MKTHISLRLLPLASLPLLLASCLGDEPGTDKAWRARNDAYMIEQAARTDAQGQPYYTRINCPWDPDGYVLMRWHNDRTKTSEGITPMSTSTVDVIYRVGNIDGLGIDSSYYRTTPADSVYRSVLNTNIQGWQIALTQMHVGDTCTVVIPYDQAYGINSKGSIAAYSDLIFDVKLVGIPGWEKPVK